MRLQFPLSAAWRSWLQRWNTVPPAEGALLVEPRARYVVPITDILGDSPLPAVQAQLNYVGSDLGPLTLPQGTDEWRAYRANGFDVRIDPIPGTVITILRAQVVMAGLTIDQIREFVIPATQEPPFGWWLNNDGPYRNAGNFNVAWNEYQTQADVLALADLVWASYSDDHLPLTISPDDPEVNFAVFMGLPPLPNDIQIPNFSVGLWISIQAVGQNYEIPGINP